jgi:hypothetical protein
MKQVNLVFDFYEHFIGCKSKVKLSIARTFNDNLIEFGNYSNGNNKRIIFVHQTLNLCTLK